MCKLPSPVALCPFIGAGVQGSADAGRVRHWDKTNPEDRTKWRTQHDPLLALGPPYVYHVVSSSLTYDDFVGKGMHGHGEIEIWKDRIES